MEKNNDSRLREQLVRLNEENELLRSALDRTECGKALVKQQDEFSSIIDISKKIVSELDISKIFTLVARNAKILVDAELVIVPMLNEARDRYTYMAAEGPDADKVLNSSFQVSVGMCGWVLQNERSLLFGEASKCWLDEKTQWEEGQQSALLVPLFGRKRIIGGISALGKRSGGSFTNHDLDLLTIFSNQVSTAIENAMLFSSLERSIEEKDVLLAEVHHRVKNNMALISSILQMQSLLVDEEPVKLMLKECEQRVRSMALVHQKLYISKDVSDISVEEYIRDLVNDLQASYGKHDVEISENIEPIGFGLDVLIPFGLIINEIVSNAFKHAFNNTESPKITIDLKHKNGYATLSISDNGTGFQRSDSNKRKRTLGLDIIDSLSGQINADIKRTAENGVRYIISFPLTQR